MKAEADISWAAGFFEGEGCFYLVRRKPGQGRNSASASLKQVNLEPLLRFQSVVGGRIHGPYAGGENRQDIYQWQASGDRAVAGVVDMLWDGLSTKRRREACKVLVGDA